MVRRSVALAVACLTLGCVSAGREFPVDAVNELVIGTTTRADVEQLFGEPWLTGIEDGLPTYTYGRIRYSVFAPERGATTGATGRCAAGQRLG